jgi:hypothetical protein
MNRTPPPSERPREAEETAKTTSGTATPRARQSGARATRVGSPLDWEDVRTGQKMERSCWAQRGEPAHKGNRILSRQWPLARARPGLPARSTVEFFYFDLFAKKKIKSSPFTNKSHQITWRDSLSHGHRCHINLIGLKIIFGIQNKSYNFEWCDSSFIIPFGVTA